MSSRKSYIGRRSIAKEIAEKLNQEGLKTKMGKSYTPTQVYQVARGNYADTNIERLLQELSSDNI
jgi:hypothetical protein